MKSILLTLSFGICTATVKNIIRQNKKSDLQEFLFGSQDSIAAIEPEKDFEAKIENIQQQVDSL